VIRYAIRYVQVDQEKLELGERQQFLFYSDDEQRERERERERAKISVLHWKIQNFINFKIAVLV